MTTPDLYPLAKKKHPFDICECGEHMRVGADQCGECRNKARKRRKREHRKLPWWMKEVKPVTPYKKKKSEARALTFGETNGKILGNILPRH